MDGRVISLDTAAGSSSDEVGGKAAGLAALRANGFPVPDGDVITASAYVQAIESCGLGAEPVDSREESLRERYEHALATLRQVEIDARLLEAINASSQRLLSLGARVAVRSSATLEDSEQASFAGLLDTIPGASSPDEVIDAVRRCWASGFKPRVSSYLAEKSYAFVDLEIAVVLQLQLEPERSGLVFSRDPVNRYAGGVVVEAIHGFGEDLVSGEVTPERYSFSRETGRVTVTRTIAGAVTTTRNAPREVEFGPLEERRLNDAEVALLAGWARRAEELFGMPQDMEWAYADGEFWVLQSRPLLFAHREEHLFPQIAEHTVLAQGAGVSPSVGSGKVLLLPEGEPAPVLDPDVVVVLPRLTNDIALHLRHAAGVVADEGGATSHGANILREFEVPCVIGAGSATRDLREGRAVTVDGFRGAVYEGDLALKTIQVEGVPSTRTKVFVSVLVPDRAAVVAHRADGVSSLRDDYFLLDAGVHPSRLISDGQGEVLRAAICRGLMRCSELFEGKPVWYKTMDAPTDEFLRLAGGEEEPRERNPLLGWRGIGRELVERPMLDLEFGAIARAVQSGCSNIAIKLPFVRFVSEYTDVEEALRLRGLTPHENVGLGVSVETPAVAMRLQEFLEAGADFVSVGLSDLTMCTLALDRESRHVSPMFDPSHPAVVELLERIVGACRQYGTFCCVAGESARDERVLPLLVALGYDAVAASPSYFAEVKRRIAAIEAAQQRAAPVSSSETSEEWD